MHQSVARVVLLTAALSAVSLLHHGAEGQVTTARCLVAKGSGKGDVQGTITLSQPAGTGIVTLKIDLTGFNTTGTLKRGFHVHADASLGNKCVDAGLHLNNMKRLHGAPTDTEPNRHTGDLGNLEITPQGTVSVTITDWLISLNGANSVIGKPIVIHTGEDDLNKGGTPLSNTTGNAGERVGCCLIVAGASNLIHSTWAILAALVVFQILQNGKV
jgi:Cu-Zn family superoxide dismutase